MFLALSEMLSVGGTLGSQRQGEQIGSLNFSTPKGPVPKKCFVHDLLRLECCVLTAVYSMVHHCFCHSVSPAPPPPPPNRLWKFLSRLVRSYSAPKKHTGNNIYRKWSGPECFILGWRNHVPHSKNSTPRGAKASLLATNSVVTNCSTANLTPAILDFSLQQDFLFFFFFFI